MENPWKAHGKPMENCGKPLTYMINPPNMYGRGASLKVWDSCINFGKHSRSYSYRSNPVAKRSPMAHRSGRYHRRWWYDVITCDNQAMGDTIGRSGWMYVYIYIRIYIYITHTTQYFWFYQEPVFYEQSNAIESATLRSGEKRQKWDLHVHPSKENGYRFIVFIGTYMNWNNWNTPTKKPKWSKMRICDASWASPGIAR